MQKQNRESWFLQPTFVFLIGGVLAIALLLGSGCADTMFSDLSQPATTRRADNGAKFRHAHLLDRALRTDDAIAGKSTSANNGRKLGLIVALDKQRALDRFRVLERFRALDRFRVLDRYDYEHALYGFALEIEDTTGLADFQAFIDLLELDPDVVFFEPDIPTHNGPSARSANSGTGGQHTPPGINRIGGSGHSASGVDVFVLDTGVSSEDVQLASAVDFTGSASGTADFDGHGTHIAGTIAALDDDDGVVGVAPGARIHSLKVVPDDDPNPDDGAVDLSTAIAAVEHATAQKLSNPNAPMVVNISLGADVGTTAYTALDEAIEASSAVGVIYVVSAGNYGADASTVTPAHAASAITVGAYDPATDAFASFSNYGSVVDILAPGVGIESLAPGTSLERMDGTSMATAHVTGAVALFLSDNPQASAAQVAAALTTSGDGVIQGVPAGTTDKTVRVAELLQMQLPPFFHYAITGGNDLDFFEGVYVGVETDARINASVFANNNLNLKEPGVLIEGFAYYGNNAQGYLAESLHPRYNPTGLTPVQRVQEIPEPAFDPQDHLGVATQQFSDDLFLAGHYDLGTREAPAVWYIDGKIVTTGDVSFSGYGILMATGDVEIKHQITTDAGFGETRLGLYTGNNFKVRTANLSLAAQIFVDNNAEFVGNTTLYGSITVGNNLKFKGTATIYYRPASPVLTEPLWPMAGKR